MSKPFMESDMTREELLASIAKNGFQLLADGRYYNSEDGQYCEVDGTKFRITSTAKTRRVVRAERNRMYGDDGI